MAATVAPDVSGLPPAASIPLSILAALASIWLLVAQGRRIWRGAETAAKEDAAVEGVTAKAAASAGVPVEDPVNVKTLVEGQARQIASLEERLDAMDARLGKVERERDALALEVRKLRGRNKDQAEIISDLLRHAEALAEWGEKGGAKPPGPEYSWRIREAIEHERALRRQRGALDDEDDPP